MTIESMGPSIFHMFPMKIPWRSGAPLRSSQAFGAAMFLGPPAGVEATHGALHAGGGVVLW